MAKHHKGKHNHPDAHAKEVAAERKRIETSIDRISAGWSTEVKTAVAKAEADISLPRGYGYALVRAENPLGDVNHDNKGSEGQVISSGLTQTSPETAKETYNLHSKFMREHGYPDFSKIDLHDPLANAYLGMLHFKDLMHQHSPKGTNDPSRAYLYYVHPKMAEKIILAQDRGDVTTTAQQLAVGQHAVTRQNPNVYGPKRNGEYTVAELIHHNHNKFAGIVSTKILNNWKIQESAPAGTTLHDHVLSVTAADGKATQYTSRTTPPLDSFGGQAASVASLGSTTAASAPLDTGSNGVDSSAAVAPTPAKHSPHHHTTHKAGGGHLPRGVHLDSFGGGQAASVASLGAATLASAPAGALGNDTATTTPVNRRTTSLANDLQLIVTPAAVRASKAATPQSSIIPGAPLSEADKILGGHVITKSKGFLGLGRHTLYDGQEPSHAEKKEISLALKEQKAWRKGDIEKAEALEAKLKGIEAKTGVAPTDHGFDPLASGALVTMPSTAVPQPVNILPPGVTYNTGEVSADTSVARTHKKPGHGGHGHHHTLPHKPRHAHHHIKAESANKGCTVGEKLNGLKPVTLKAGNNPKPNNLVAWGKPVQTKGIPMRSTTQLKNQNSVAGAMATPKAAVGNSGSRGLMNASPNSRGMPEPKDIFEMQVKYESPVA